MGLSCPSLPVVLASPSITGLVPLLKLAHLGPAPPPSCSELYCILHSTGLGGVCLYMESLDLRELRFTQNTSLFEPSPFGSQLILVH